MNNLDDKTLLDAMDNGAINFTCFRAVRSGGWEWFDQSQGPANNRWTPAASVRECLTCLVQNPPKKPEPPKVPQPAATPAKTPGK